MKKRNPIVFLLLLINCIAFSQSAKYVDLNFSNGQVDTFTINKTMFRILMVDTTRNNLILEKFHEGWAGWMSIDSFDTYPSHYTRIYDINQDGYNDIGVIERNSCEVFLYNPSIQTFTRSGFYSPQEFDEGAYNSAGTIVHMQILNKEMDLYFDYLPQKRNQWTSRIFRVVNYKRVELGSIGTNPIEGSMDKIESITIAKEGEDYEKVMKLTGTQKFDYASYWKQNWRKFLPK